jgi:predicted PurR-regulated permease PerM
MEGRLVYFRPRTVLVVLAVVLATALVLRVLWVTRDVLIWAAIAVFLAMALNPAVEWLQARGIRRRGLAVGIVFVGAVLGIAAVGALFVPTLVREVNDFAQAVPDYVDDLTKGRGRLGFLERDYQIVEKVREAIEKSGAAGVLGLSSTAVAVTKSVISAVVAVLTIAFLTLFMLLEGPAWVERIYSLLPETSQPRWRRVGHEIYRTVGGYVTGNLAISFVAGVASTTVLLVLGVPYAVALGLLVAILDLVPLAGATIAAVIVATVGFLHSIRRRADRVLRRLPAVREPRAPAARLRPHRAALAARRPDRGADGRQTGGRGGRARCDPDRRLDAGRVARLARPPAPDPGRARLVVRRPGSAALGAASVSLSAEEKSALGRRKTRLRSVTN